MARREIKLIIGHDELKKILERKFDIKIEAMTNTEAGAYIAGIELDIKEEEAK